MEENIQYYLITEQEYFDKDWIDIRKFVSSNNNWIDNSRTRYKIEEKSQITY